MLGIFAMSKEAPPYGLIKPNWNKAQKKTYTMFEFDHER
jgi:hypothetical protein